MPMKQNKALLAIASIIILEFSLILAWFWMTGNYDQIRFGVWPMSEWLINYQGGFVRRGLLGEVLFQLSPGQPLIPLLNHLTFYLYAIYCLIFLLIYWLAKIRNSLVLIVALLIPGGIFQMAISASFFTRKEILFLILFGLLCLLYLRICSLDIRRRRIWIGAFTLLAIVGGICLTLTHEAFLFMGFPYVLTLFWVLKTENQQSAIARIAFKVIVIAIPSVFLLCTLEHGNVLISQQIWDSLTLSDRLVISPHAPYTVYGAIGGIGWGKIQNLSTLYGVFATGGWFYWLLFGLGNYLVLGFILRNLTQLEPNDAVMTKCTSNSRFITLLSIPFIASLAMFAIGSDWGRWIASAGNHLILLAFTLSTSLYALTKNNRNIHVWPQSFFKARFLGGGIFLSGILIYELVFKMPECCVEFPYIFIQYLDFVRASIN
jgi:hypothetical protein